MIKKEEARNEIKSESDEEDELESGTDDRGKISCPEES